MSLRTGLSLKHCQACLSGTARPYLRWGSGSMKMTYAQQHKLVAELGRSHGGDTRPLAVQGCLQAVGEIPLAAATSPCTPGSRLLSGMYKWQLRWRTHGSLPQ
jgi:hypothetical protein